MEIFDRIAELRRGKGWSESELLRRMHLSTSGLQDWRKKGKIPDRRIDELAYYLDTTPEYLRGLTDNPNIPDDKKNASTSDIVEAAAIRSLLEELGIAKPGVPIDKDTLIGIRELIRRNADLLPTLAQKSKDSIE